MRYTATHRRSSDIHRERTGAKYGEGQISTYATAGLGQREAGSHSS